MSYDFSKLSMYIDKLRCEKHLPGADVIVYLKGKEIFRYIAGNVDTNTLYFLYSCTKPVTVTATMQLIEQNIISLDDPVSIYIPAFKNAVFRKGDQLVSADKILKIRHLLTMSAGLNYNIGSDSIKKVINLNPNASTMEIIPSFIDNNPLDFEPGSKFQYSLCHDVLAGIIEVVSGLHFSEYLRKNIFEPLNMKSATFHLPKEKYYLASQQYIAEDDKIKSIPKGIGAFAISPAYESGGAGLICTAEDYGKFAAAMSCGGVSADGVRILDSQTIDLLRTPQLNEEHGFSCAGGPGYAYAYGVRTLYTNMYGAKSHIGEFGWDGAAGSYILMDPDSQIGIVYTQQVLSWPRYFGCMHAPIRDIVYDAINS